AAPAAALVPEQKKFSSRGLYIGVGSAATIVLLILAATQLPKFLSTKADAPANTPVAEQPQQPATPP
ncbi:MAG TPA: hypothetical protein DEH78_14680, partial [Solibacterales bacterium]|nr:hypothetical protein [Bryobacterales bacterium]